MGLIKSAIGAITGTLADSWKDAIHCEKMNNATILRCGTKMNNGSNRSSNYKGTDNVISNGSQIIVEENTCMLTIDNGKITNLVTEPGGYVFDTSSAPSIFAGKITDSFKDVWRRFTYGGTPSYEQRVVYINLQKLPGIPFGTSIPMPYFDPKYNTTVDLRFFGTFEIQIPDAEKAMLFYREVAGKGVNSGDLTVADIFKTDQYKNEFMQSMMEALNSMSAQGISYNQISSKLTELTTSVQAATANNWLQRGFLVTNVGMGGAVTLSEESKELLKDRLKADTMLGGDVQKAIMVGSVAKGIESAGSNEAGAMMGFAGFGMGMNAGTNVLNAFGAAQPTQPTQPAPTSAPQSGINAWTCSCGTTNSGAFCSNCGSKKPDNGWDCSCGTHNTGKFCANCGKSKEGDAAKTASWVCSCGKTNTGKFCAECGSPKPSAPKRYKCDKCGWAPADPTKPPKFCPECGDPFNDDDLT